ncbi:hypothetical protein MiSe_67250 [Microseira wollei NIES-4236]|uniref:Uncharacterized protein n=1 Tax=Microseira wollei NIES-4236 TaxID=2530354 RepID=A0AAV3XK74_9CYAN|nr:hypothetical protein MiSe_67250 [Microseira wollei NIES-4236]
MPGFETCVGRFCLCRRDFNRPHLCPKSLFSRLWQSIAPPTLEGWGYTNKVRKARTEENSKF